MKYIKLLFLVIIIFGCDRSSNDSIAFGSWYSCKKDGSYWEYKITKNYMIMLANGSDFIYKHKVRLQGDKIILSNYKNGGGYTTIANEPLKPIRINKNRIVLKNLYRNDDIELNKAKFQFAEIDSTNLESWKNKIKSEFNKRKKLANCPDLRTEEEKIIPVLELEMPKEVDIPITE